MIAEDTICYKISRSIDELSEALATGDLNIILHTRRLHEIRDSAQKMENALKLRRSVLKEHGLEEVHQALKGERAVPPGLNKIANKEEQQTTDDTTFEFTIKQKEEIIYQNTVKAGVLWVVEEITDIDADGMIDGRAQNFIFGNKIGIWYAFDQLRQAMEAKKFEIMAAFKSAIERKDFVNPHVKAQIIRATNLIKK